MQRDIEILHAPSPLGLKPPAEGRVPGVWRMPEALEKAGLHGSLGAVFAGEVPPPSYLPDIDPEVGVRNPHAIVQYLLALATQAERLLDSPGFPVVLGGDCSILIGTALGLRRRGRYGLIYIDAHPDYLTPETSRTAGVAGMLAGATGRGPDLLSRIERREPYILETDVAVVGCRDPLQIAGATEKWVQGSRIRVDDLEEVRRREPRVLAGELLTRMSDGQQVDRVWIHLDVDVLHESIMPAVDSPEPRGLSQKELTDLLDPLLASPVVCGLQVTIYDPERDPDGSAARVLVGVLPRPSANFWRVKSARPDATEQSTPSLLPAGEVKFIAIPGVCGV